MPNQEYHCLCLPSCCLHDQYAGMLLGGEKMQTAIITTVTNATISHLDDRRR